MHTNNTEELVDEIVKTLKEKNPSMRATNQRIDILKFLIETDSHPTVDEIYQNLKADYPSMSLATVYNTVHFLVDAGYLYELTHSHDGKRYDFIGQRHYHVICQECGKVADFYYPDIKEINLAAHEQTGYHISETKLALFGLCPTCLVEKEKKLSDSTNMKE